MISRIVGLSEKGEERKKNTQAEGTFGQMMTNVGKHLDSQGHKCPELYSCFPTQIYAFVEQLHKLPTTSHNPAPTWMLREPVMTQTGEGP